jgi:outer membrane protein assembly factor BamB
MFARRLIACVVGLLMCQVVTPASAQQVEPWAKLAGSVMEQGGVQRGVASVCGADSDFVLALARSSELLLHVRDPRQEFVHRLRSAAKERGLGLDRLVVERGELGHLPYADNMIDLLVTTQAGSEAVSDLTVPEVLRVLRPRGVGLLGKALATTGPDANLESLVKLARQAGATNVKTVENEQGSWVRFTKPPMAGADDWSHWEHSPDNNPVSTDTSIRAPYMTQFLAHPMYIGMPSITTASAGRTFLAIGHISHHRREWDNLYRLIARNGYNGTVLWERRLPEGYLVHRSAFIATPNTFYMLDGDGCLMLDPETGAEMNRLTLPDVRGEWKWMVLKDGVLYVMTGPKERGTQIVRGDREVGGWSWADLSPGFYGQYPHGFGNTLAAYDLADQKLLWVHREEAKIDSRAMAVRDGQIYLMCPERHLRCLDAATGDIVWENSERDIRDLIEEPGQGLRSTPGFKTMCVTVATPDALIIQGQTRMNVVAVSTKTGYRLWTKRKITNNPNALYVDGRIVLGVGEGGSHVVVDPVSGEVEEDLKFRKVACTRLTASGDSFFCRGEGTLRFDRESKQVQINGSVRPGCNDGAIPANGMLYIGPWQCDCNLSLIGTIAKCSAEDFRFDYEARDEDRLESVATLDDSASATVEPADWPTLRGNVARSSHTIKPVAKKVEPQWTYYPAGRSTVTPAVAAWNLIFWAGADGVIRAVSANDGKPRWEYETLAPIKAPPTLWEGRLYVGSGDGYVYCLAGQSGKLLWRFRAAPVERHMMVYGRMTSTWPVNTGVTIHNGIAYFAAGIIDEDGTYVYALDARSGKIQWQNNSSGHLNPELRKGVSAQGNMTVLGDQLLLAGGNQVSPAPFDLKTGELRAKPFDQGQPKANNGQFAGAFQNQAVIVGGRILYSAADNVATKGKFVAFTGKRAFAVNNGGVPPAWDDRVTALVNFKHGSITCFDTPDVVAQLQGEQLTGAPNDRAARWLNLTDKLRSSDQVRWETNLGQPNKFEAVSMAVAQNAVVAVVRYQQKFRSQPQWYVTALDLVGGKPIFQHELRSDPLPGGLLIDRKGQIIVSLLDGGVLCLSEKS